jgi:heptosyltransferase-2/heptosyltransferase-3
MRAAARLQAMRIVGLALGRGRPRAIGGPPRILIVRPDHIGDAILAAPTGIALRQAFPNATIDWLVGPWSAEVIHRSEHADNVFTLEFPGFTRQPRAGALEPYRLVAREQGWIRARRYDVAIVARPDHWWGALLVAASGVSRRIGYDVSECRPFLTRALARRVEHARESGLRLAAEAARQIGAGVTTGSPMPRFAVRESERAWAAATVPERDRLVLHPGSGSPLKNWPADRWAEVLRDIRQLGPETLITAGPGELVVAQRIAAAVHPSPRVVDGLDLGQLAALYERAVLVIGCDSGPLHLAAAVGTPTLRLYGPTDPTVFGPVGDADRHVVLTSPLPCRPCGNIVDPPCGASAFPDCMRETESSRVVAAARRLLGGQAC